MPRDKGNREKNIESNNKSTMNKYNKNAATAFNLFTNHSLFLASGRPVVQLLNANLQIDPK
jgi:hypothetical protein